MDSISWLGRGRVFASLDTTTSRKVWARVGTVPIHVCKMLHCAVVAIITTILVEVSYELHNIFILRSLADWGYRFYLVVAGSFTACNDFLSKFFFTCLPFTVFNLNLTITRRSGTVSLSVEAHEWTLWHRNTCHFWNGGATLKLRSVYSYTW